LGRANCRLRSYEKVITFLTILSSAQEPDEKEKGVVTDSLDYVFFSSG